MRSRRARRASLCAALAAAALGAPACGGGERQDEGDRGGDYTVDLERARFATSQRIAKRETLVITVRNAGTTTIPNLAVTVRGFARRTAGSEDADPSRSVWTVDAGPTGASTANADTWATGALRPGARTTLRWRLTPVLAGTHVVTYAVAPGLQGGGRARLRDGAAARGRLTVKVTDRPAFARVDPRTGGVVRDDG